MVDLESYVRSWMDELARHRPLFHSERDLQLALALVLADDVAQLRLEKALSVSERWADGADWLSTCWIESATSFGRAGLSQ
ncbi:hypothetical protein [Nocardia farcinica]|uniref:hypothetical protein n=1 Tax=Nocardia farcinica TaxID=37329 RepID=UPI000A392850|nr:hypothetical protein [Nocardia farcinica]PFX00072.1 hypothetical protein CJ469_04855 [Nocardia farcinica]PFX05939.1 hypothetical protein CJ468_05046 [Nocardia farcinica]SUE28324.1 Uncharacterised protein [Nocardia farcinica]